MTGQNRTSAEVLFSMKKKIASKREEVSKLEGRLEELKNQIWAQFGVRSLDELKRILKDKEENVACAKQVLQNAERKLAELLPDNK